MTINEKVGDSLYGVYTEDTDPNAIPNIPTPQTPKYKKEGFDFTSVKIDEAGGIVFYPVYVTDTYYANRNDRYILADGTFTVYMPDESIGHEITVKNVGTGSITVQSDDFIDVATTFSLSSQWDWITMVRSQDPSFSNWNIVSKT
jgi:hypothetical protein